MKEIDDIKMTIENNNIPELKEMLKDISVLDRLIEANEFDAMSVICDNIQTNELTEALFYAVISYCGNDYINKTAIKVLEMLKCHSDVSSLNIDFSDVDNIYYVCQYDANVEFLKLFSEIEINTDWNEVMMTSCLFAQKSMFDFLIEKFNFNSETINQSLVNVINSGNFNACSDDPAQIYIIRKLIQNMGADVNQDDSDWGCLYLDCFQNVPFAAKYFYTKKFIFDFINSTDFWASIIKKFDSNIKKQRYINALLDFKNSNLNKDELINIFNDLDRHELANLISNK